MLKSFTLTGTLLVCLAFSAEAGVQITKFDPPLSISVFAELCQRTNPSTFCRLILIWMGKLISGCSTVSAAWGPILTDRLVSFLTFLWVQLLEPI